MTDAVIEREVGIGADLAVFLKTEVKLELLSGGWYVWPHLIAPAQHAMNIAFRHLPVLKSFVANPSVHAAAVKDPKMFGGPFVCLPVSDVPRVRTLIGETMVRFARLIRFAEDYRAYDRLLQQTAKGASLDKLYASLPDSLAGLVELVYDLENTPCIRILEELLSLDTQQDLDWQEVSLALERDDQRPFFMSTPRLPSATRLNLPIPFSDPRVDALARLRYVPGRFAEVCDTLGVGAAAPVFANFLTTTPPVRNAPHYDGDAVRLRHFGHACVLLQTRSISVLIDPSLPGETHSTETRFTFADLPDWIDLVVLTHGHQDHLIPEFLAQLRHRIGRIVVPRHNAGSLADPSLKLILERLGFTDISVVDPFDTIALPEGSLQFLPFLGEHADLDIRTKHTVMAELRGRRLLFLIDSDAVNPAIYDRMASLLGRLDAMFIGMECNGAPLTWLYGPLFTRPVGRRDDETRRLSGSSFEHAWNVVTRVDCARVFVYAMGQEVWMRHLMGLEYTEDSIQLRESNKLIETCRANGILAERLNGCVEMVF
jgi:L-ascorbate metabolism protein UlaG (beta-lactamase superfamily)